MKRYMATSIKTFLLYFLRSGFGYIFDHG